MTKLLQTGEMNFVIEIPTYGFQAGRFAKIIERTGVRLHPEFIKHENCYFRFRIVKFPYNPFFFQTSNHYHPIFHDIRLLHK